MQASDETTPAKVVAAVGARLRRLRRMRSLTLEQVAASAELSPSFLSMLERGQADVTLGRLARLAAVFNLPARELLAEDSDSPTVIQPLDGMYVDRGPGITYRLVPADQLGVQLIHVLFQPRTTFADALAHDGKDFAFVIRGEVVLEYGLEEYRIKTSEAVTYTATTRHRFRNDADQGAEIFALTTPSYW